MWELNKRQLGRKTEKLEMDMGKESLDADGTESIERKKICDKVKRR